jgi:hypothetical protein
MKSGDLFTYALLGVAGWILYEHLSAGKTWGQSLATIPGGSYIASQLGLSGLGCQTCPSQSFACGKCRGMGAMGSNAPWSSGSALISTGVERRFFGSGH